MPVKDYLRESEIITISNRNLDWNELGEFFELEAEEFIFKSCTISVPENRTISNLKLKYLALIDCNIDRFSISDSQIREIKFKLISSFKSVYFENLNCERFDLEGLNSTTQDIPLSTFYRCSVNSIWFGVPLGDIKIRQSDVSSFVTNSRIANVELDEVNSPEFSIDNQYIIPKVSELQISGGKELYVRDCFFDKVRVEGPKSISLNLLSSQFGSMILSDISIPKDKGAIVDLEVVNEIIMSDVNFFNCLFEKTNLDCQKAIIRDCLLNDVKSLETRWPNQLESDPIVNLRGYRSLSILMKSWGEYSKSDYYRFKELETNLIVQKAKRKSFWGHFDHFFTLKIPYFTSRYGNSLSRPVGQLLLVHLLFTIIMFLNITGFQEIYDRLLAGNPQFFNLYAYTILPTHKLSFEGVYLNPIISLFMRIVSAFYLYQIVLVSRKHFRTS